MAIKREKIQPQGIHVRMVDGQARYTQVVTVSGTGKMIFVAGQLARDARGNCVGKGDMRAQIQQVGENIKTCLEAAGATLADIVKTNTFVTDYGSSPSTPTCGCGISARRRRPLRRSRSAAWPIPTR